ncbi:unnamed protein product [Rotaria sp. Silwood2]|nr:unnamed protein product [Rotaria sp. Silwood2]
MIIVQSILKELSARRILTYAQIEARLEAFEYGQNDQSNKPPTVRPKHLTNNHIPGSASQKLLLFQMLPIIFHDVINRLIDLLPIYTCLREIVSIVFATRIRKSWLPYLTSVTISFHSLMIDKLPDNITAKVHFITHYPELIKRNGPPRNYWCQRFEGKHLYFKKLAIRSSNFKNVSFTLAKRHQLRLGLLLSYETFYHLIDQTISTKSIKSSQLPIDIKLLLVQNHLDSLTYIECQTLIHNHVKYIKNSVFIIALHHGEEIPEFVLLRYILKLTDTWKLIVQHLETSSFDQTLWSYEITYLEKFSVMNLDECVNILPHGLDVYFLKKSSFVNVLTQEEIDGHLLQKLRFEEIKSLFPKLKQTTLFLDEREKLSYKLCSEKIQSNPTPIDDDDQEEQSLFVDENMKSSDSIPFVDEVVIENTEVSSSNSSNNHSDDEENDDQLIEKEIKLQEDYELPPFPTDLKFVIDQKDFTKLAAHSNLRRVLLNLVYDDIANKHHLLYPKSQDYIVITKAILRSLNIPVDNKDALNEYRESIKQKFKNERKPLQKINAQVQRNKNKFGKGPGRPVKKTDLVSAERKNEKLMFIGQLDDEQDMFKLNQMLKDEFNKKPVNMEALTYFWKKTFTYRRLFTRNNVIKEVLLEYPAYSLTSLVFEEVRMTTDTDIERNVQLFLPMLFEKLPDNSMFISVAKENTYTVSNTPKDEFISSGKQSTAAPSDLNIFQTIEKSSFDTEATIISTQHPSKRKKTTSNNEATTLSRRRQPKRSRLS